MIQSFFLNKPIRVTTEMALANHNDIAVTTELIRNYLFASITGCFRRRRLWLWRPSGPTFHNVSGKADGRNGDQGEGLGLRQGPDQSAAAAKSRQLHQHRLPSVQRHEVLAKLLRERPARENVLPLPGPAFQEGQAQVEDHQPGSIYSFCITVATITGWV